MSKKIAKNGYRYLYTTTKYYGVVVHADTKEKARRLLRENFIPENEEHNDKYYLNHHTVKHANFAERDEYWINECASLRDLKGNLLPEKEWEDENNEEEENEQVADKEHPEVKYYHIKGAMVDHVEGKFKTRNDVEQAFQDEEETEAGERYHGIRAELSANFGRYVQQSPDNFSKETYLDPDYDDLVEITKEEFDNLNNVEEIKDIYELSHLDDEEDE